MQQLGFLSERSLLIFPPYPWRPPVNSTNQPPAYVADATPQAADYRYVSSPESS